MKVLIIDDEEDTRSICSLSLGLIGGAEVIEAASGPEGIKTAAQEQPDVIILDLLMPDMDGAETLRNLRKNAETIKIPVIFLTTVGMFNEFDGLRDLGALAVIAKPFDPVLIGSQIQEILENSKSSKQSTNSSTPGAEAAGGEKS
jgi:CheY-like chemotaxis protein